MGRGEPSFQRWMDRPDGGDDFADRGFRQRPGRFLDFR
jgi:hypothetical protein